jgi:UBX domain-containing protein 6
MVPSNVVQYIVCAFLFVPVVRENVLILHLWLCSVPLLQVGQCVDTLCKYLENIIQNPTEEKFQKIRMTNRVYQDRVAHMEGAQDFLIAAGFKVEKLPYQDGEEDFWVFSKENLDSEETQLVSICCDTYIINQISSHTLTCV